MTTDQPNEIHTGNFPVADVASKTAGRSSAARISIVVAVVVFLAGGFVACHCPGIFVVMGICSLVALATGSRRQRLIALMLLGVATIGFLIEFRAESEERSRLRNRIHRIKDVQAAQPQKE